MKNFFTMLLILVSSSTLSASNISVSSAIIGNNGPSAPKSVTGIMSATQKIQFTVSSNDNGNSKREFTWKVQIGNSTLLTGTATIEANSNNTTFTAHTGFTFSEGDTPIKIEVLNNGANPIDTENFTVRYKKIPLPVELVSFAGFTNKGLVVLNWVTASEKAFDSFLVQESKEGTEFLTIGSVKGIGTGSIYSFTTPATTDSYFRLKMVDNDGKVKYSPVIFIADNKGFTIIELYDIQGRRLPLDTPKQGFVISVETDKSGHRKISKIFYQ